MANNGRIVRIGCGAGFWGDSDSGAAQLVERGNIDYLVFDFLAEITMSLLTRARQKDPELGYAVDFVSKVMCRLLKDIVARKIKVVTNAGGVNPRGCQKALEALMRELGVSARVAVVLGDDVSGSIESLRAQGVREMFDGRELPQKVTSANAYLGARAIANALDAGADIVITGRCVDSAVVLGPLMHEFGWQDTDYDRLAGGSLLGHLVECGCMGTGGVFSDWDQVPGWDDMGYPIIECHADGSGVLTKPEGTGGLVTPPVAAEQMLYEIGDPRAYLLPDVCCDWTGVTLSQVGPDRVLVSGARGSAPSTSYKVCATYQDGWRATTSLTVVGGDAAGKARRVADAIIDKSGRLLRERNLPPFLDTSVEVVGSGEMYGAQAGAAPAREVMLKIAVHHSDRAGAELFCHEVMPAITATAPGISGFFAGRPSPVPVVRLFSMLVEKSEVPVSIALGEEERPVDIHGSPGAVLPARPARSVSNGQGGETVSVPISRLAYARSGDKGDTANIGVVARRPEYYELLREHLTEEVMKGFFSHFVRGEVERYEVRGIDGLNFVLNNALGGGGIASLRIDPQGKCLAPILLDLPLDLPVSAARERGLA